jgi:uncharacterized repeat protein (TIGR01451 family)
MNLRRCVFLLLLCVVSAASQNLPPEISKSFGGILAVPVGSSATLTFTIANPNAVPLTGVGFTDNLPPGLVVSPVQPSASCNGTPVVAAPGTNLISLAGATIPPNGQCTFQVNVTAVQSGLQVNFTSAVTSDNGGTGNEAFAQIQVGDILQVHYAAHLNVADSVFTFTNTGMEEPESRLMIAPGPSNGFVCLNVYVFSPDEQMISCCACPITPNGLGYLSAKQHLISKPLTPAVPSSIVVKILTTSSDGPCNAAVVSPDILANGIAAWGTTVHPLPTPGAYGITETPFRPATLSATELSRLAPLCGFIQGNGSGYGICAPCRTGALGAARQ